MKKLLSIVLLAVFSVAAFAFALPKSVDTVEKSANTIDVSNTAENVVLEEEEAFYCHVENANGNSATCWFCDCSGLADSLDDE